MPRCLACTLAFLLASALLVQAEPAPAPPSAPATAPATVRAVERARLLAQFDYTPTPITATRRTEERFLTYVMDRVEMPSPVVTPIASNNTLYGFFYRPLLRSNAAVIVLPIANGRDLTLEKAVAIYLAHRGFNAFVMPMPYQQERGRDLGGKDVLKMDADLDAFRDGLRQAVLDVKRVRQWLVDEAKVDPGRVGLVGISLGSLVASVSYSVDPGFGAAALVLSGGDLAHVVFHGSKETRKIKERLEGAGRDLEWTRAAIRPMDPLSFASPRLRDGVFMVNASRDEVFPFEDTAKLYYAYGKPGIMLLPGDHYSVAVFLPVVLEGVARHLRSRLLGDEPVRRAAEVGLPREGL
ncbi:MAG: hypothetical protein HZA54_11690 [Planctomycetes bacterium]|nr:hypothetical protein [Planctomycetota bacterium]